ncbi:unnamed protein product [Auanema sp. JU1783]|nr:unnamed protein product [Auanema sp. JU1783]
MDDSNEFRVVTLNVWCLPQPWPIGSKDRRYRLQKLSDHFNIEPYDVIGLQEIWGAEDYNFLVEKLSDVYPYHHYFHSGWTGSGVCVFSRHKIVSTLTHRYSLNGFAHHIHRGDWFGGKIIGMVELEYKEKRINFYTTHLHAEYDRENDLYLPHRTSQAFELSQFVRHTCSGADMTVVCGDFNLEPEDLGFRIILSQAKLRDAWRMSHEPLPDDECHSLTSCRGIPKGGTCDRPDNCYTSLLLRDKDESKRIDYILFKSGKTNVTLEECEITLNKIPSETINYSDHVGLHARFTFKEEIRQQSISWEPNRPLLIEAIGIVAGGQRRARKDRMIFGFAALLLVLLLLITLLLDDLSWYLSIVFAFVKFGITVAAVFCAWHGVIGLTLERKALKASKQSMEQQLND